MRKTYKNSTNRRKIGKYRAPIFRKVVATLSLLAAAVVLCAFYSPVEFERYADRLGAEYLLYTTESVGAPVFAVEGTTVYATEEKQCLDCSLIVGEELIIEGDRTRLTELLVLFAVVGYTVQELDGVTVITGHSRKLTGSGDNLQIAFTAQNIKVGTPILLGCY